MPDKYQDVRFTLKSDDEFYCYLKAHLPKGYTIVSEPEKSHFSEWSFHYVLFHEDKVMKEYRGSFLEIEKGSLFQEAKRLLTKIKGQGTC